MAINIYYDPTLDRSSSTPESKREFSYGSRVITLNQGNNVVDIMTLFSLESFSTFVEGVDKWFLVDRNFTPPDATSPELDPPEQMTLEVTE